MDCVGRTSVSAPCRARTKLTQAESERQCEFMRRRSEKRGSKCVQGGSGHRRYSGPGRSNQLELREKTMMNRRLGSQFALAGMLLLASSLLVAPAAAKQGADLEQFEIRTLSNRADLISGGDALVEVT